MLTPTQAGAPSGRPSQWHRQAACVLDELRGAACLSLILATLLSLAGVSHGSWQWLCLIGGPAWVGLRAAKLL
jgi:hypothetical protein